jgi:NitT/TauT family transport system permease protein
MRSSELEVRAGTPSRGRNGFARRVGELDIVGIALKALRIMLFYLALLGLWQLAYNAEIWSRFLFPSPGEVWDSLQQYIDNGVLWEATKASMERMFIGYTLSLVAGFVIGMLCGVNRYADETVGSLVLGLQSLPSITWLPLALLWFGLNDNAIIFVVFMGSVCAVAISARAGVRGIPPLYRRAALTMGANPYQRLRYVLVPAMVPSMAQGLKLGWSFSWRSLMAAELLFVSISLGHLLQVGRDLNNMSLVIGIMFVIVAIGLAVDRLLFARLESWVFERWGWQSG